MSDRTTIIVGGAGFLGSAVAHRLSHAGRRVIVADLETRLIANVDALEGIETAVVPFPDLTGLERLLDGADAVVHFSCTSTPASSMIDLARDSAENITPSVSLFEAAGRAGVSRVVYASSGGTVYGNPKLLPVPEHAAGSPLSGYGVSKLAIEHYLSLVAARDGFSGVSLRIGNPYGAFQLRGAAIGVIANYLSKVYRGEAPEVWGDGGVVRDYIHVDDVAAAFVTALETPAIASGAYNIGSGSGASINEIWETIRSITATDLTLRHRPARDFDVDAIVLDTTRFQNATGWTPKVDLRSGVANLWDALLHSAEERDQGVA